MKKYWIEKRGRKMFLVDENGEFMNHYREDSYVIRDNENCHTLKAKYPNGFWIMVDGDESTDQEWHEDGI
jgi:hypothetical protein